MDVLYFIDMAMRKLRLDEASAPYARLILGSELVDDRGLDNETWDAGCDMVQAEACSLYLLCSFIPSFSLKMAHLDEQ